MSSLLLEPSRRQVAVAGSVVDAFTQKPLAGVQVTLVEMPEALRARCDLLRRLAGEQWNGLGPRPDRVYTARDGHYHFMDLPPGRYALQATLAGAGTRYGLSQPVTIEIEALTAGHWARADLELPPTVLQGTVSDGQALTESAGIGASMITISVIGSGERAYCDAQGRYCLVGLEAGRRAIQVSQRGKQWSQTVTLALGQVNIYDVILEPGLATG